MAALVLDEVLRGGVEGLPRQFLIGEHVVDHLGEVVEALAFDLVLGFDVADGAGDRRIALLQDLVDHILLRMMAGSPGTP